MNSKKIKILFLEDSPQDVSLEEYALRKGGVSFESLRIETIESFYLALQRFEPDVILSDYSFPTFHGMMALKVLQEKGLKIPFIFVSGSIGEDMAVELMRSGATDFILKDHLYRLATSVKRAVSEAEEHRLREATQKLLIEKTERLLNYQQVLLKMTQEISSNIQEVLHQITEMSAMTLNVERVSLWHYNDKKTEIICDDLFELSKGQHTQGIVLKIEDYPHYFHALQESRLIAVKEAQLDPRTREFAEGYLKPLKIVSMLDVPIRIEGEVMGVLCHEHVGLMREWFVEEQNFASSIADMFSIKIESMKRKAVEQELLRIKKDFNLS